MREIKYRGLTTKGEMIYGSLVVTDSFIKHMPKQHTKTWIVQSAFGNGGWFNIRMRKYVKPETVGQYTGKDDIHGNPIYEGDVVMSDYYYPDMDCELTIVYCPYEMKFKAGGGEQDAFEYGNLEVIGNIHQPDIEF